MRLAVLSDIHGNIRALDAVLADIRSRGIEQIVNLGDCLYGPFDPAPVANCLRAGGWPTISGNEDRVLVAADKQQASRTAQFTVEQLTDEQIDWLAKLPRTLVLDDGILACHGTPTDDTQYLLHRPTEDGTMRPATDAEIVERLGPVDVPLILCGHDHMPHIARLADGRTIVNPGAVGLPAYTDDTPIPHRVENGSPHARYAVVHWDNPAEPQVELVSVSYDWTAAAAEAERNGFSEWANWLATGRV